MSDPPRCCKSEVGGWIVCRKHGISQQSFYLWKKRYSGLGLNELRELRQLRDENGKLKRLVADLSLDRHILQEIAARSCKASGASRACRVGAAGPSDDPATRCEADSGDRMTLHYEHHNHPQEALRVRLR